MQPQRDIAKSSYAVVSSWVPFYPISLSRKVMDLSIPTTDPGLSRLGSKHCLHLNSTGKERDTDGMRGRGGEREREREGGRGREREREREGERERERGITDRFYTEWLSS